MVVGLLFVLNTLGSLASFSVFRIRKVLLTSILTFFAILVADQRSFKETTREESMKSESA